MINTKDKKQNYGNSSMKNLKGAERVRTRPSVIFGSDDIKGATHTLYEIVTNSKDEAVGGFCDTIKVTRHKDLSWTVADNGRGIPLDYNPSEECWNWEIALYELYGGGKYENGEEESGYGEGTGGLNGLGLASTQYASKFMDVTSRRDGYEYKISFKKGQVVGDIDTALKKEAKTYKNTGTVIHYKLDDEVFTDIALDPLTISIMLKKIAIINKKLRIEFIDEITEETKEFYYENGIKDYLEEICPSSYTDTFEFSKSGKGKDTEKRKEYKASYQAVFCFSKDVNENVKLFHNGIELIHGGSTKDGLEKAFVNSIDKVIKEKNLYVKKEKKISTIDVMDTLNIIISSTSTFTSFSNQTKTAINNKFIQELVYKDLVEKLDVLFIENTELALEVAKQVLINKRAREKAEQTKSNLKKKLEGEITVTSKIDGFINCKIKDNRITELYVAEGRSALGALTKARNSDFQACFPVRGKTINSLKSELEKILANDIVFRFIKVLGCGIECSKGKNKDLNSFDISKLRWDKVILASDGDYDGYQIRCLLLTTIYKVMPSLILEGKVYIAEAPIFEITSGKDVYYVFNEEEKVKVIEDLKAQGRKFTIDRNKGLGEMTPLAMKETMMCPQTRRIIQVNMADMEKANEMFELFLGEDIIKRRDYIIENFDKVEI